MSITPAPGYQNVGTLTFSSIPGTGDVQVLNYALSLEALEADLYVQALARLTTGGTNSVGKRLPGLGLNSTSPAVQYLQKFAQVEADHRDFLANALGSQAITQTVLATAGFDFGFDQIPPGQELQTVLNQVLAAEALGVGAYLGAIPSFATKNYVPVAAAILGTEARHTAVLTAVYNQFFGTSNPTAPLYNQNAGKDTPVPQNQVLATVSPNIFTKTQNR